MIKRKFVFIIGVMIVILTGVLMGAGISDGLTAMTAVGQLSNDIVVNSAARSIVNHDTYNIILNVFMSFGLAGIGMGFIPKSKKENDND